jgi:YHS domain-containing protein
MKSWSGKDIIAGLSKDSGYWRTIGFTVSVRHCRSELRRCYVVISSAYGDVMEYIVRDPICGKSMVWLDSLMFSYNGNLFYFCCKSCLNRFRHAPRRYSCNRCMNRNEAHA